MNPLSAVRDCHLCANPLSDMYDCQPCTIWQRYHMIVDTYHLKQQSFYQLFFKLRKHGIHLASSQSYTADNRAQLTVTYGRQSRMLDSRTRPASSHGCRPCAGDPAWPAIAHGKQPRTVDSRALPEASRGRPSRMTDSCAQPTVALENSYGSTGRPNGRPNATPRHQPQPASQSPAAAPPAPACTPGPPRMRRPCPPRRSMRPIRPKRNPVAGE